LLPILIACEGGPRIEGDAKPKVAETPNDQVKRRAGERWQALIRQDFDAAYTYLSPGYRAMRSLELYKSRDFGRRVHWKAAEVKAVSCEPEVCTAQVDVTYVYLGKIEALAGQETVAPMTEKWVLAEGQWWHLPEK